jgi:type II secretory ATPase GspE/PulE/Tfp pilus assembly ATPase PilB-like protein
MRDRESIALALEAALTGRLVLSSLHTARAFETIVRLRQQGLEPYDLAAALRGIVSQRLVPKLCTECRELTQSTARALNRMTSTGLWESGSPEPAMWHAPGCAKCRNSGVQGRVGVFEVLTMTPPLQAGIQSGLSEGELLGLTPPGSYLPLARYARHLLENGLASAASLCALFPAATGKSSEPAAR